MAGIIPIISAVSDIIGRFVPDPVKKAEAQLAVMQLQMQPDLAQIEINKQEAMSSSVFVAGWRPAIGWLCVIALGFAYVAVPLLTTFVPEAHIPKFPMDEMINLVYALLGLGAMRTVEKVQGIRK